MTEIKFITDATLGKLAKWLRLLGYDTVIYSKEAGRALLRQADTEKRVVLTKRRDLLERQFAGRIFLVTANDIGGQINSLAAELSLTFSEENMFRICLCCNERLISASPEEVKDLVPLHVYESYTQFTKCPHCEKIYWPGTHQRNSLALIYSRLSAAVLHGDEKTG